jgi:acyl dehydratase
VFKPGTYDVTREEIIEFLRKYDPFAFHIDEQAAQQTVFAGIISIDHLSSPMAG